MCEDLLETTTLFWSSETFCHKYGHAPSLFRNLGYSTECIINLSRSNSPVLTEQNETSRKSPMLEDNNGQTASATKFSTFCGVGGGEIKKRSISIRFGLDKLRGQHPKRPSRLKYYRCMYIDCDKSVEPTEIYAKIKSTWH